MSSERVLYNLPKDMQSNYGNQDPNSDRTLLSKLWFTVLFPPGLPNIDQVLLYTRLQPRNWRDVIHFRKRIFPSDVLLPLPKSLAGFVILTKSDCLVSVFPKCLGRILLMVWGCEKVVLFLILFHSFWGDAQFGAIPFDFSNICSIFSEGRERKAPEQSLGEQCGLPAI